MRMKPALVLLLLVLVPRSAGAAGETVSYNVGRETVRAYLARPTGPAGAPGLVVLHEMWGLNEQIMRAADHLSRMGYVAIAPDLYRGKLGADPGLAEDMMRALESGRALEIVKGAIDQLRNLDGASGRPVGTVGFGMGGRLALEAALHGFDVGATIIFYGKVETTPEAVAPIRSPILGFFGSRDPGVRKQDVAKFEAAMKQSGKDVRIIMNEGIGHGFMNEERADFEPEMSKDSWAIMKKWLAIKLPTAAQADPSAGPPVPSTTGQ